MDKIKSFLNGNDGNASESNHAPEERGIIDQALDASTLSWGTRVKGFLACFVLGCFISILSTILFAISLKPVIFAVLYSIGNVIALSSTLFLMGPVNQIKRMFAPTRIIATIVMLLCLVLTLMAALWWANSGLTILFCILQFCAMAWYSISYIPYARDAIAKGVNSCLG